jgi:hypothetical protein
VDTLSEAELRNALNQSKKTLKVLQKAVFQSKKLLNQLHNKLYGCPLPEGKEETERFFENLEQKSTDDIYQHQVDRVKQEADHAKAVCRLFAFIVPIALSVAAVGLIFIMNPAHRPDIFAVGTIIALLGIFVAFNKKVQKNIILILANHIINKVTKVCDKVTKELGKQYTYREKLIGQLCDERDRYFCLVNQQIEAIRESIKLGDELLFLLEKRVEE